MEVPIASTVDTTSGSRESHIVKADEVDQTGSDISPVPDDQLMEKVAEDLLRQQQVLSEAPETLNSSTGSMEAAERPPLRRDGSAPPPPLQPPPPAPVTQDASRPQDSSISLAQLRKLVQEIPKIEQPAYAFEYADAQSFPDELDEWFQYNQFDRVMLTGMRVTFERQWNVFCQQQGTAGDEQPWTEVSEAMRQSFVMRSLENLQSNDVSTRLESLDNLCYAVTGVWGITGGRESPEYSEDTTPQSAAETPRSKSLQITWIEKNVTLLQRCGGIAALILRLSQLYDKNRATLGPDPEELELERLNPGDIAASEREANLVLTLLYFSVEVGRRQEAQNAQNTSMRDALAASNPCLLVTIVEVIARLRWDESANIPLTRIILLLWKSILLVFGGTEKLKRTKEILEPPLISEEEAAARRTPFLTAKPLDYHLFRQEITSKYPSYNPPPSVVPLELENNSILPPLPQHPNRPNASTGLFCGVGPSITGGNGSIIQQAVHIATPAPSPPPSPIGPGGKAGKKQNYQTNQNFPLLYPPLDDTSNRIGGKGTTERQDVLVGKRWDGSDVPASVIEAGKLFSTHVKMTRGMRQLWEERENFMKYDRGWNLEQYQPPVPDFSFLDDTTAGLEQMNLNESGSRSCRKDTDDPDVQRRLDAVEGFYAQILAHLQSITIVFLKIILTNVSAMVNQPNSQGSQNASSSNGTGVSSSHMALDISIDELDNIRLREITGKAVSGTLLLLLKWFKRSHILKFEYMTQLLLDSNYLPLILKMFAHQDVDQAVAQKNDREDLSFFHFCSENSEYAVARQHTDYGDTESEDEAAPPPISRHRPPLTTSDSVVRAFSPEGYIEDMLDGPTRPEVDELGYPTAPPPKEPITTFSFRNFFSAINYLHIMQKITRDKAHRCLLLVQYKSSTILRKGLKIPDPYLRFYTLKLFKSQVPYCGRKWRQSNMRVITAIYLYCRPELRDDWLAGSDVDAEVEEALPLEQALRGLTHWWHLRQYKDVMGGHTDAHLMEEERDFFTRELESMGWGLAEDVNGEDSDHGSHQVGSGEWVDGQLPVDGPWP
ncbi:hypothetical protein PDE_03535 [Penicillium oxalicum 114-2]|uniref:Far11/STRP C-terminal domain-containing protein n=1 Tax=Penicillium oxalicum (strain 114-2 / CGMCC 5302) TaxID=933388 RepID=S7ZE68_PENO1|nr:hypothetical protein PDE_03535 [Penicillium oxalicum 114-2]